MNVLPWRQEIANAIEVVQMEMDAAHAASVPDLVNVVTIEAPRTQVATLRLKKLLGKLGKPAYDISIHVLSDIMSETAKRPRYEALTSRAPPLCQRASAAGWRDYM